MKSNIIISLGILISVASCGSSHNEIQYIQHDGESLQEQLSKIEIREQDADINEYGFNNSALEYVESLEYFTQIEDDSCWGETLEAMKFRRSAPKHAEVITTVEQLSSMKSGKTYYVKGDLEIPTQSVTLTGGDVESKGIDIPSNVSIYIEGSIYKEGLFMGDTDPDDGIEEENKWDFIFNLEDSENVKIYGIGRAKIYSEGRSVAFYMGGKASNIYIEGFYITDVWEAFSSQFGAENIILQRNSIARTGKRAIWMLGTNNSNFSYNVIYLPGWDGFDFDAHNKNGVSYGNIIIGAGRWAGFVEEAAQYNYIVKSLCIMEPTYSKERWQMGFADNGTSSSIIANSGKLTENNYFIASMAVQPSSYHTASNNRGGGNFFAYENAGKGMTYFWGNIELGCEHNESGGKWYNAVWLDYIPTNAQTKIQQLREIAESYMFD